MPIALDDFLRDLPDHERAAIQARVAELLARRDVSEILVLSGPKLDEREVVTLSDRDRDRFLAALESDAGPSEALGRAAGRMRRVIESSPDDDRRRIS